MKITRSQLRNLIETFLQEVDVMSPGVDIMMPGSGRATPGLPSGFTPFPKPRDLEGEIPDDIVLGAEILLGFTPVGVAVDFKDLAIAIEENDPALAIAAGIGFIPVIGDLFKIPYKATAAQAKYLRQLEKELGTEGIEKLRKKTSVPSKVAVKAVRSIRVLEPNIVLDANDDFRKAVYPVAVDGSEYVVTLIKRSYGAPVQVSFNVPGAEAFKMTGQGNVMRVVDGVFETVKDFNKRFPGEKSFSFTGAVQGGPRPSPGEATKRARVFSGLLQRKISRDPELAAMVKKIRDASWAGDANTWKIDLHELRQIIKEVLSEQENRVPFQMSFEPIDVERRVHHFHKDLNITSSQGPVTALSPDEIKNMTSGELSSAIRKELLKNLDLYKPGTKNADRVVRMLQRDAASEYAGSGVTGEVASYDQIKDRYDNEIFEKIKDVFENVPIRENNNMGNDTTAAKVLFGAYWAETENPLTVTKESEIAVEFRPPEKTAQLIDSGVVDSFEKLFAHEAAHLFKAAFVVAAGNDIFLNNERYKDDAGDIEKMQARDIKSLFSSDETWGGTTEEQRAELVSYRSWLESQTGEGYTKEIVDILCLRGKLADNRNNKEEFDRILSDIHKKYNILGPEDSSNIYQRIIRGAKSGLVFDNIHVNSAPHMDLNLDVVKYLNCNSMNDRKIDIMNRIVKADIENDSIVAESLWLKIAGIE